MHVRHLCPCNSTAAILEDAVVHGVIQPIWITEKNMVADPFTKYFVYHTVQFGVLEIGVWRSPALIS